MNAAPERTYTSTESVAIKTAPEVSTKPTVVDAAMELVTKEELPITFVDRFTGKPGGVCKKPLWSYKILEESYYQNPLDHGLTKCKLVVKRIFKLSRNRIISEDVITVRAKARLHEGDVFDAETGKKTAKHNALNKLDNLLIRRNRKLIEELTAGLDNDLEIIFRLHLETHRIANRELRRLVEALPEA